MEPDKIAPAMSDDAVMARTGKTWSEWFAILDAAGAAKMTHPQIASYLSTQQGVPDWWSQMVAVTYEKARGLREQHQQPDGYQISKGKTFQVPAMRVLLPGTIQLSAQTGCRHWILPSQPPLRASPSAPRFPTARAWM